MPDEVTPYTRSELREATQLQGSRGAREGGAGGSTKGVDSLLSLCIAAARDHVDRIPSFHTLPMDLAQLVFDALVSKRKLTKDVLPKFKGCHLYKVCQ